jgi:predicted phosphate transport protein (TIGR00153 family)
MPGALDRLRRTLSFSFLSRNEREVVTGLELLIDTALAAVEGFSGILKAAGAGEEKEASFVRVFENEKKADELQRELNAKIAKGSFFGGIREDMLKLIENADNIADCAKDSARLLETGSIKGAGAEFLRSPKMQDFVADLVASVKALRECVVALQKGRNATLAAIPRVEQLEESADAKKDELLKELFSRADKIDPLAVIQIRDMIYLMDDFADNAEDSSDVMLTMVAKGYG